MYDLKFDAYTLTSLLILGGHVKVAVFASLAAAAGDKLLAVASACY